MINNFCVTTLTHNAPDRADALRAAITSFMQEYTGSKFEWFIVVNVTNEDINKTLEWAVEEFNERVQFNIRINQKNSGPGGGINQLNKLASEYEYQLFIEGDWMVVPNKITGAGDWIQNSVRLLEDNKDIDQIHYRRYLDDLDDRQYGFSYWTREDNILKKLDNGTSFLLLKNREYTNNPSMRRMSKFYQEGVFPLDTFDNEDGSSNEVKGNPMWGQAELRAMGKTKKSLNAAWLEFGNFVHYEDWHYKENWDAYIEDNFGCGIPNLKAHNRCKYGYLVPGHFFCAVCEKNTDITDLVRHSNSYLKHVLPLEHNNEEGTIDDIFRILDDIVEVPMIDARSYVDVETYYNVRYIRTKRPKNQ